MSLTVTFFTLYVCCFQNYYCFFLFCFVFTLTFDSLMYGVTLLTFNLFGVLWASWICMTVPHHKSGKFSDLALRILCFFLFVFSLWNSYDVLIFSFNGFSCLFLLCFSDWIIPNALSSRSLIISSAWLSLLLKLLWILPFNICVLYL